MTSDLARQLLERVYHTREQELDCAGMMDVMDRYVEVEARGDDLTPYAPQVPDHLFQCPDCKDLVVALSYLVRLEESGNLPEISELWTELRAATAVGL